MTTRNKRVTKGRKLYFLLRRYLFRHVSCKLFNNILFKHLCPHDSVSNIRKQG